MSQQWKWSRKYNRHERLLCYILHAIPQPEQCFRKME